MKYSQGGDSMLLVSTHDCVKRNRSLCKTIFTDRDFNGTCSLCILLDFSDSSQYNPSNIKISHVF